MNPSISDEEVDLEYISQATKDSEVNNILLVSFAILGTVASQWCHFAIKQLDLRPNIVLYIIGVAASISSLLYSFRTIKSLYKLRIAQKGKISLDVDILPSDDQKASKKQAKIIRKRNEAIDKEACYQAIMTYNALFLIVGMACSNLVFVKTRPIVNYVLSTALSCFTVLIHSKNAISA